MKKLYFLLSALLVSFAASAETLTVNVTKYIDENTDNEWGDDITVEATISNGVVTIVDDLFGLGKNFAFTCYADGTANHNYAAGYYKGTITLSSFGSYSQAYLYGNNSSYPDAYYNDDEYGKYIYFGFNVTDDGSNWDWYDTYINLPEDFETAPAPFKYSGTANVTAYSLVDGVETGDGIAETLGITISDRTLSISNAFGYTSLASYLSFVINEDGSVTGPTPGYFTKTNGYTFNGETYSRLYDNTYEYDVDTNTFIWGISLSASGNGSDNLDYAVHIPLPDEFAAGVKNVAVDSAVVDGPVEYFNLQGIRVANPENGLYIRRQGNTATKVIVK